MTHAPREGYVHRHRVRVGYIDTDLGGIVHHSVYLRWLEEGRIEFLRAQGVDYRSVELDEKLALPVAEANLDYKRPARFDEVLEVETRVGHLGAASIRFDYTIRREDETLLEATILLACVRLPEMRVCRLPALVRDVCTPA